MKYLSPIFQGPTRLVRKHGPLRQIGPLRISVYHRKGGLKPLNSSSRGNNGRYKRVILVSLWRNSEVPRTAGRYSLQSVCGVPWRGVRGCFGRVGVSAWYLECPTTLILSLAHPPNMIFLKRFWKGMELIIAHVVWNIQVWNLESDNRPLDQTRGSNWSPISTMAPVLLHHLILLSSLKCVRDLILSMSCWMLPGRELLVPFKKAAETKARFGRFKWAPMLLRDKRFSLHLSFHLIG